MTDSDNRLRVAVILGGASSEREVSIKSGRTVAMALEPKLYKVRVFDPAIDMAKLAAAAPEIDVALVMLHGRGGEDGSLQGFLDLLGIPYQCAGVLGCALAMDKPVAKGMYRQAGLPVASDMVITQNTVNPDKMVLSSLGLPVVVKPAREGSSVGVAIVQREEDLKEAIEDALRLDTEVLVETYLKGREVTCVVIGNQELNALPLIEIIPGDKYAFFDFQAKYVPGASREECPADLDTETTSIIQELAIEAHRALRLKGYSRTDFILTQNGPFLLETNTIPGMTETSLVPLAAKAAGMEMPVLLRRLIDLALEKP